MPTLTFLSFKTLLKVLENGSLEIPPIPAREHECDVGWGRMLWCLFGNRISTVMPPLVGLSWGLGTSQTGCDQLRWVLVINDFLGDCIVGSWWHFGRTCLRPPKTALQVFVHADQQTCGSGVWVGPPIFPGGLQGSPD